MLKDLRLQLTNYKVSADQRSFIKSEVSSLFKRIPKNSRVRFSLSYKKRVLYGRLTLSIGKRIFYAKDESATLDTLVTSLVYKVQKQTQKRKRIRKRKGIIELRKQQEWIQKRIAS